MSENNKNYYQIIDKHLKKQYPKTTSADRKCLCREVVFAPLDYTVEINDTKTNISNVRETLADFIEKDAAKKNFIPYSLDAEIADLIESTNCETSSMNEYYRWITQTETILKNAADNNITQEDLDERQDFISMSYDRESELLLCLALYEASSPTQNKEKINLMKFKLARLREMRSIVKNTPDRPTPLSEKYKRQIRLYQEYCRNLLQQKLNNLENINLKLNVNINHNTEDDLTADFSYLNHLRCIILYTMRKLEKGAAQNELKETLSITRDQDPALKQQKTQER